MPNEAMTTCPITDSAIVYQHKQLADGLLRSSSLNAFKPIGLRAVAFFFPEDIGDQGSNWTPTAAQIDQLEMVPLGNLWHSESRLVERQFASLQELRHPLVAGRMVIIASWHWGGKHESGRPYFTSFFVPRGNHPEKFVGLKMPSRQAMMTADDRTAFNLLLKRFPWLDGADGFLRESLKPALLPGHELPKPKKNNGNGNTKQDSFKSGGSGDETPRRWAQAVGINLDEEMLRNTHVFRTHPLALPLDDQGQRDIDLLTLALEYPLLVNGNERFRRTVFGCPRGFSINSPETNGQVDVLELQSAEDEPEDREAEIQTFRERFAQGNPWQLIFVLTAVDRRPTRSSAEEDWYGHHYSIACVNLFLDPTGMEKKFIYNERPFIMEAIDRKMREQEEGKEEEPAEA